MINLLPYETKKQTSAARMNVILLRYIFILFISAAFLAISIAVIYLFIRDENGSSTSVANGQTSNSSVQKQADTLRTDLATAKSILDDQVAYSNVITGIAAALPAGTILDSLSLSEGSFGTTTNLKILSRTADNETKIKENFKNSTLFSNYKLLSSTPNNDNSSGYPYTINISITINKGVAQWKKSNYKPVA